VAMLFRFLTNIISLLFISQNMFNCLYKSFAQLIDEHEISSCTQMWKGEGLNPLNILNIHMELLHLCFV
jgi:hypothetical protein